jgi:hypothetical protein
VTLYVTPLSLMAIAARDGRIAAIDFLADPHRPRWTDLSFLDP